MKESTLQCHVADCDKPSKCHGYCAKHYTRFCRHGDPLVNLYKGVKKHPLYGTWLAMKNRCYNPNSEDWPRYGGRGIRVCDRWRDDFCAFADDMGERPDGHTIDRIDFNGDYCPENCRWITQTQQCRNKSTNVFLEYKGTVYILKDLADMVGVDRKKLKRRIDKGMTIEAAINDIKR